MNVWRILVSAWFLLYVAHTHTKTWTVMIYAQSDAILHSYVQRDISAMTRVNLHEDVSVVIQWNRPRREGTHRYAIEENSLRLVDADERIPATFVDDLIQFSNFAATRYPADDYIFIFWSHGSGILDPAWHELSNFCVTPETRGLLFDTCKQSYLKNEALYTAFSYITKNIIGKKFAIIGMDACLMAMLEVFYQIKDFGHYSVCSQEIELAQGWDYVPILQSFSHTLTDVKTLAYEIVSTFENFYRDRTDFYTQSAIDLSYIDPITKNLDHIVQHLSLCHQAAPYITKKIVSQARNRCFQLTVPSYIDLHSFYESLCNAIGRVEQTPLFIELEKIISAGMLLLEGAILSNVASEHFYGARGMSLYYPLDKIAPSYFKTEFAKSSAWISFLKKIAL